MRTKMSAAVVALLAGALTFPSSQLRWWRVWKSGHLLVKQDWNEGLDRLGFQSRPTDKASTRGTHQGQRSCAIAPKGRTHDCKRTSAPHENNSCRLGAIHT
jgi:hypothetical protein